jgi:hypothetical protein
MVQELCKDFTPLGLNKILNSTITGLEIKLVDQTEEKLVSLEAHIHIKSVCTNILSE